MYLIRMLTDPLDVKEYTVQMLSSDQCELSSTLEGTTIVPPTKLLRRREAPILAIMSAVLIVDLTAPETTPTA